MRQPYIMYHEVEPLSINDRMIGKHIQTYSKFRKEIRSLLEKSYDGIVHVYRERRGEWGEWFEHWQLIDGKPKIIKEGWM